MASGCGAIGPARMGSAEVPEQESDFWKRAQEFSTLVCNYLFELWQAIVTWWNGTSPVELSIREPQLITHNANNELSPPPEATAPTPSGDVALSSPEIAGAILPFDLLVETLSYLTPMDGWLASQVCRWWQQLLARDDRLRVQVWRHDATDAVVQAIEMEAERMRYYRGLCSYKTTCWAAGHGYLALLQWLQTLDFHWNESTCAMAARGGHLAVLQWLRANRCPWDRQTCAMAAGDGHLATLQWARANGCPWDEGTCEWAANGKHLGVLQWARANGCPWSPWTCAIAAEKGHLEILQWLHANGCPWDEETCASAAFAGHLAVLQWLRANDCPWNARTLSPFVAIRHPHVVEWARANGCPEAGF